MAAPNGVSPHAGRTGSPAQSVVATLCLIHTGISGYPYRGGPWAGARGGRAVFHHPSHTRGWGGHPLLQEYGSGLWGPIGAYGDLLTPMGTYGNLWAPIGAYGDLWAPPGAYGGLWGPIGAYGDLLTPMGTNWHLWEPMGTCGGLWGPIGTYWDLWRTIGTYGD